MPEIQKTPKKKVKDMTAKEKLERAKEKARIKREKDRSSKKEKDARKKAHKAALRIRKGQTKDENDSCSMTGVWKIFSKYIRLRDSDSEGYGTCITYKAHRPGQSSRIFWRDGQAGHFWSRRIKPLLFDEMNVHLQDYACNAKHLGNGEFAYYMDEVMRRYGNAHYRRMMMIAKHEDRYLGTFDKSELKDLRDKFTEKLNAETDKRGWPRIEKPWK